MLAALAARPDDALDPVLRAAVAEHAAAWAARVGRPLAAETFDELDALLAGHDGRVLLVSPDVPRLDDALAASALADLDAGCVLSFAPATDARPYLIALAAASPELLALFHGVRKRDVIFAEATRLGEVGLLRSERRLVTPEDARALALDPLAPPALLALARAAHTAG